MGWFGERLAAFGWAKGHRAWLYSFGSSLFFAAGVEVWPRIREKLPDWVVVPASSEGGGVTILGHPVWPFFVVFGLACLCIWLFESVVKAYRELSPKFEVRFDPDGGGVSLTTLTNKMTGEFIDDVKYVRVSANSISQTPVRGCVGNLVKIERRLDSTKIETIWDQDALPLTWSIVGGIETTINPSTKRYVDLARIQRELPQLEFLTHIPNRLAPDLKKTGTFLLTVIVTGDGVSKDVVVEIKTDGTFDGLEAKAV